MASILGVDVGGTFTDFLLLADGRLTTFKRPSTPSDPAAGVLAGIGEMAALPDEVVHGSTVATNAVLERKGARTGLVNTRGLRDVLEIGRQTRPRLYDLEPHRPEPLVPRELRYEVDERVDAAGAIVRPLSPAEIEAVLDAAQADGVESLAISLIFSYLNPGHEASIAAAARRRKLWVSASSEVAPEYREYERTSTTVVDSFVAPVVSSYLRGLETELQQRNVSRLRIVQSDGGSAGAETVAGRPVTTVLSGPAAGVAGAFAAARLAGFDQIITFDMGGTSTDVALCPGRILNRLDVDIGGLPVRTPAVDVHTVGAGGGSLARIDAGGALRVGPESAGADPGPACYGRGDRPTVTDAQLVLGRLQAQHFLGGRMALQPDRAQAAVAQLGGVAVDQAAAIVRVANSNMERAIRVISVERGFDPRDFTLVAFGGAGPLHACDLAASLRIARVLVPLWPGVLSAFGMVTAPVTRVYQRPVMRVLDDTSGEIVDLLQRLASSLEEDGRSDLTRDGYEPTSLAVELSLDMRYAGQSYELDVPFSFPKRDGQMSSAGRQAGETPGSPERAAMAEEFHAHHMQRYGHADPRRAVEVVNLRCRVIAPGYTPSLQPPAERPGGPERARLAIVRQWHGRWLDAPVYDRDLLCAGDEFRGPAVVVQMDATTVLPPGWTARVDAIGNMLLDAAT
jgi:N-methylhydantoinase A